MQAENEQLEGLLSLAEKDKERAEGAAASMEEHRRALEGKEMEISELTRRLAEAKKQEERLDREVGELAKERDEMAKKASSSEIRVMSAAQEELEAAEARVESERRAHRLTKDAALRREQDLEAAADGALHAFAGVRAGGLGPRHGGLEGVQRVVEGVAEDRLLGLHVVVDRGLRDAEVRGEHAHRACHQFLVCVKGSLGIVLDDGERRDQITLDSPQLGLHIPPMVWGIQYQFSPDAVLLVLASHRYEAEDYIRNYDDFLAAVRAGQSGSPA